MYVPWQPQLTWLNKHKSIVAKNFAPLPPCIDKLQSVSVLVVVPVFTPLFLYFVWLLLPLLFLLSILLFLCSLFLLLLLDVCFSLVGFALSKAYRRHGAKQTV